MPADDGPPLLERGAELALIDEALVDARAGDGTLVVVEGETGIGKTALLRAAEARARAAGMAVLATGGSELEGDLPYALARHLFAPEGIDIDELGGGAVAVDLCARAEARSEAQPLAIVVDDLQWADRPTLGFLAHLVRRLADRRVAVVVAAPLRSPAAGGLRSAAGRAVRVQPGPLSAAAIEALVAGDLGEAPAGPFVEACRAATGGNPLLLGLLVEQLAERGWRGTAAEAAGVTEVGSPPLADAVLRRLGRCPPTTTWVAQCAAVLGDGTPLRQVSTLAGLDAASTADAVTRLVQQRVLEDETPLRFVHPIVRQSIYGQLTAAHRAHLHARAAEVLAEETAPAEGIAAHVVLAAPEGCPGTVALLREVARRSLRHGDADAAARYLDRAVEEPPPAELRDEVEVERAVARLRAGRLTSLDDLAGAVARCADPAVRARGGRTLAAALFLTGRTQEAVQQLRATRERLEAELRTGAPRPLPVPAADDGEEDGERDLEVLALLVETDLARSVSFEPGLAAEVSPELHRLQRVVAAARPSNHAERLALVTEAASGVRAGAPVDRCAALAVAAHADGELVRAEDTASARFVDATTPLIFCDELDLAAQVLGRALEEAQRTGSALGRAQVLLTRSLLAYRQGRLRDAEADARAVLAAEDELPAPVAPLLAAWLVLPTVVRGDLDGAEAALADRGAAGAVESTHSSAFVLEARGWLRLAQGDAAGAAEDLLDCGARLGALGVANPTVIPWRSAAAHALAACGERADAAALAEDALARARTFGTPRAIGTALRGVAATQSGDARLATLAGAVEHLERAPAPLELARALADQGMALRRARRRTEAQGPLRRALDLAARCDAGLLASRVEHELRATGARPRRRRLAGPGALTPTERRIAEMAATGATNRQIAQRLFVSPRTVENHMASILRKLGIPARTEIARALARERPGSPSA
jgi:DNA-binding CsgD family transcriptional regulator